jgi:hypothetical protein
VIAATLDIVSVVLMYSVVIYAAVFGIPQEPAPPSHIRALALAAIVGYAWMFARWLVLEARAWMTP